MGNVFHGVLELFARKLAEYGYTWFDFPKGEAARMVEEAVEAYGGSSEHPHHREEQVS